MKDSRIISSMSFFIVKLKQIKISDLNNSGLYINPNCGHPDLWLCPLFAHIVILNDVYKDWIDMNWAKWFTIPSNARNSQQLFLIEKKRNNTLCQVEKKSAQAQQKCSNTSFRLAKGRVTFFLCVCVRK